MLVTNLSINLYSKKLKIKLRKIFFSIISAGSDKRHDDCRDAPKNRNVADRLAEQLRRSVPKTTARPQGSRIPKDPRHESTQISHYPLVIQSTSRSKLKKQNPVLQGLRKTEQIQLVEEFKQRLNSEASNELAGNIVPESPEHEAGRIKRLEKLIKKRM